MAKEFITKKYDKKVDGKKVEKETTYRIDIDFVPAKLEEICLEFMTNYCIAKNDTQWLSDMLTTKIKYVVSKGKNKGETKERKYTEKEIKKEFVGRYFENLKAKEKEKSPFETALEKIQAAQNKE